MQLKDRHELFEEAWNDLDESIGKSKTDYDKAQVKSYNILKKNPKVFGVIYAFTQYGGKHILDRPLAKMSQSEIDDFVRSFSHGKESTKVVVDVMYQSQLNKVRAALEDRGLIEPDLEEALENKPIRGKHCPKCGAELDDTGICTKCDNTLWYYPTEAERSRFKTVEVKMNKDNTTEVPLTEAQKRKKLVEEQVAERDKRVVAKYRKLAGLSDDDEITEDNLNKEALNSCSCYCNYDIDELREVLLNKGK
jgi:uncharacterized Zn finger protein (UPF0148 family)